MERARRVAQFWRYLPAFRVVAETESIRHAASLLHVSPPALSRVIKLMEEDLGEELFHREGRRLRLSKAGKEMLEAVRTAMRFVDDGFSRATGAWMQGSVHISVPGALLSVALEVVGELRVELPGLVPHLSSCSQGEVGQKLRRGGLDLALVHEAPSGDEFVLKRLPSLVCRVYCGPGHRLYGSGPLSLGDLEEEAFVVTTGGPEDWIEGWPLDLKRRVGVAVCRENLARQLCGRGEYLALLPEVVCRGGELRALELDLAFSLPLLVVFRSQFCEDNAVQRTLEALERRLGV